MFDKLKSAEARFQELEKRSADPSAYADAGAYAALMKEYRRLEPVVMTFQNYNAVKQELADTKELLQSTSDKDLKALATAEFESLTDRLSKLQEELKIMDMYVLMLLLREQVDIQNNLIGLLVVVATQMLQRIVLLFLVVLSRK